MNCNYPLCHTPALFVPVVEIPTVRTVGLHKPQLSHMAMDPFFMESIGLNAGVAISQYEEADAYYKLHSDDLVHTDKPTYLIGKEICQKHRDSYKLADWFTEAEWKHLREAAYEKGFFLPSVDIVIITFKLLGWTPKQSLEMVR